MQEKKEKELNVSNLLSDAMKFNFVGRKIIN